MKISDGSQEGNGRSPFSFQTSIQFKVSLSNESVMIMTVVCLAHHLVKSRSAIAAFKSMNLWNGNWMFRLSVVILIMGVLTTPLDPSKWSLR